MSILSTILTTLVAIEFIYIMYLETIATTSTATSRVFNLTQDELKKKAFKVLMKNQGIYNGLIGLGLLYSVYLSNASLELVRVVLVYIILVAIYGGVTSNKKIIVTQGGLAIIALISTFF